MRTGDRLSSAMLLTIALALFAIVLCLEVIGPPPAWRIDVLWVQGHSRAVRLMIAALTIAATVSVILFLFRGRRYRNRRRMIVLLWIAAIAACMAVYWDRIPIIYDVVMKYAR